jgi:hypothetical protein
MELNDLKTMEYEQLVQLHQDRQIGWLQFLLAQEDRAQEFLNSCELRGLEPSNELAKDWIEYDEKTGMEDSDISGDAMGQYLTQNT